MRLTDRPHSTPPTNVEASNDYTGIDRGLFLSRDPTPKYLRVVQAEWTSYGPSGSPGLLKFKLAQYDTKPETPEDYNDFTFLESSPGNEWFDIATSGQTDKAILVEYWAKFIYYNYYILNSNPSPISENEKIVTGIKETGKGFTNALVPSIEEVKIVAVYSISHGEPLSLSSFKVQVTPKVGSKVTKDITETINTATTKIDPVITVSRMI